MSGWLHHPRFRSARERIEAALRVLPPHLPHRVPPIIFLCGAQDSPRRAHIRRYIEIHRPDALVFLADDVWLEISRQPGPNALKMEEELGELSDIIIIVVESAGSLTELGAFSISPKLRKKLLPILDIAKKGEKSFINTGPVNWIDNDSDFGPSIYTKFDKVLLAVDQITERMDRFDRRKIAKPHMIQRTALFLLCDLIYILGPSPLDVIQHFFAIPKGNQDIDERAFTRLLGLAKAMNLISSFSNKGKTFYNWSGKAMPPQHFDHGGYMNLALERIRVASVALVIPEAREAMSIGQTNEAA